MDLNPSKGRIRIAGVGEGRPVRLCAEPERPENLLVTLRRPGRGIQSVRKWRCSECVLSVLCWPLPVQTSFESDRSLTPHYVASELCDPGQVS